MNHQYPPHLPNFWQDGEGESLQMSSLRALLVLRPTSCSNKVTEAYFSSSKALSKGPKKKQTSEIGTVGFKPGHCGIPIVDQVERFWTTSEVDSSSSG